MSSGSIAELSWQDAWERAEKTLDGVTRRRVHGGTSDVELALLDWGGDGELVLLHHATGFCAATMAPIAKALSDRFRVIAIDARGHGESTSVDPTGDPNAYDWKVLSADLRTAVGEILELTGRNRVELAIGHSFGGALILDSAQSAPMLFGNILLCDPVIIESVAAKEAERRSGGPDLAAASRKRRDHFSTHAEAFEHFRSRRFFANFTPEALALYVGEGIGPTADGDVALKCRREVEAAIFSNSTPLDLFADADKVTADVTFLHAAQGNFSQERYAALAGLMSSARVVGLDVGHLFPLEEPERVLEAVHEMIPPRK